MTGLSIISVELHIVYSHNQIFSSRKCLHQKPFVSGRDSDGNGEFFIDRITGVIRTKVSLDHEEKSMYRLSVAATDNGHPPKQTIRMLRVEVLDLNDNRPTFTSSSLVFQVRLFCRLLCFQYILPKNIIILFTSLTRRACAWFFRATSTPHVLVCLHARARIRIRQRPILFSTARLNK